MSAAVDALAEQLSLPAPLETTAVAVSVSGEARRLAGAILEVLAGMRSITDVAVALGVTPARYYVLEARAVGGLISACEPRGPGPAIGVGLPAELERLRAERDRLKAEAARYQTLARIAQGAFALPVAPPAVCSARATTTKRPSAATLAERTSSGRKKRRPTIRALRVAARVRDAGAAGGSPANSTAPLPPTIPSTSQPEDRAP